MQRAVMTAGLSLGFRTSFLAEIAVKLQQEGYYFRESLIDLSDELADRLEVPRKLAVALRESATGPASWNKTGPVQALSEMEPDETVALPPVSDGYLTFEATQEGMVWNLRHGGFPCKLRDYEPIASPRLSPRSALGAANDRAEANHKWRLGRARDEREAEFGQLRISARRRDPSPDSWKLTAFNRRSASVSRTTSRSRSVAGFERFQWAKEATGDIGLTTPQKEPGSGCEAHPWQSKLEVVRQRSSPILRLRSPLRRKPDWRLPGLKEDSREAAIAMAAPESAKPAVTVVASPESAECVVISVASPEPAKSPEPSDVSTCDAVSPRDPNVGVSLESLHTSAAPLQRLSKATLTATTVRHEVSTPSTPASPQFPGTPAPSASFQSQVTPRVALPTVVRMASSSWIGVQTPQPALYQPHAIFQKGAPLTRSLLIPATSMAVV